MKSADVRETFLKYFEGHGHRRVPSSSLIPAADPTLLFTNSGMVQFKDCFLGNSPGYSRATTSQKCVRAGGKHNDLENVGVTPRHHTFFEMLGNFSFGDYFKKDAIAFAWELITQKFNIPKDRLRITIYKDDDEAFELWKAQGIRPDWIVRLGEKDNFWAMGDTGPCGPCTEIHYDWGSNVGCGKPTCQPGCECDVRWLEIWNLVFMQFNRDTSGKMTPLPKPSVDTGSGLERVSCVLQGVYSNYDTDLFQPLIQAIAKRVGTPYESKSELGVSMRVIADHLRSGTFLMTDGVIPSNEGRGYVLRRILRRAIRHGKKLGQDTPFIHELVKDVVGNLGAFYPELKAQQKLVQTLMREEEEKFHETLHRGMGLLEDTLRKISAEKKKTLPGEIAFKLYDTFGFPYDLIEVICRENSLSVDQSGFDSLMEKQRSMSVFNRATDGKFVESVTKVLDQKKPSVKFHGYDGLATKGKCIVLFDTEGKETAKLSEGQSGYAVFDETPFYAESGGQVGDKGSIADASGNTCANVIGTTKIAKVIVHQVKAAKTLESGKPYQLSVDPSLRKQVANNHTATHMLHAALRNVLGDRVKQAGSLVEPDRLRFDFTYPRAATAEEIQKIEDEVNQHIGDPVSTREMSYKDAIKAGALAFFDEKYGDDVRVVTVGSDPAKPFSIELCGGTHLKENTASVRLFKITAETSVASGVRRIEAITGDRAFDYFRKRDSVLHELETRLATKDDGVVKKIDQLSAEIRTLQKAQEDLRLKLAQGASGDSGGKALHEKAKEVGGIRLVAETVPDADAKILRTLVDQIRDKLKDRTIVVLASQLNGKVSLCAGLTKDLVGRWDAGKIVKELAPVIGGTGGGRPDFAQAGGSDFGAVANAFQKLESRVLQGPEGG